MGKIKRLTPTERIEEVIDWLEHPKHHPDHVFKMDTWEDKYEAGELDESGERPKWVEKNFCGTASCIAGAIVSFAKARGEVKTTDIYEYSELAAKLLEFPEDKFDALSEEMFVGREMDADGNWTGRCRALEKITPKIAAKMLRGYLETGEVKWGKVPWRD